jgi:glycosyltransferase involved in cell wall biosynthesis
MRIAMIGLRGIPHTYGGGEEFVRHAAPRLAARGHDVIVYCRSGYYRDDPAPVWDGVRRVFYPAPEHKSAGQFIHAAFATADAAFRRPDVVYVHTLPSAPHTILPWVLGQRVVVNVNGMDWARQKWGPLGKAYFHAAVRIALRTATAIVNDAEAMRRYYLERFGRDSYFIAYGAEIDTTSRPELLAPLGLVPRSYYLIASRLVPENNADLIIEAFVRSRVQRQLVIAGTANYRSAWLERVMAIRDPRIRFLGHVADAAVVRELHVSSYAYVHGHSLGGTNPALLKALGSGNCIVAFDSPFNREVLVTEDGREYGIMFPHDADALRGILEAIDADEERAEALRRRAPDRVREAYTWEQITERYETLFREVVERGRLR